MKANRRRSVTLSAILIPLLSLACNLSTDLVPTGGGSSTSPNDQQTAEWDAWLTLPEDPLQLDLAVDDSHAASAVLDYSGGTLETTGADGTAYRLEIPEGALGAPVKIVMTPLRSITAQTFEPGSAHAVDLQPEGLHLADVAILTIIPTAPIPVDQQVFFDFRGANHELGFVPPVVDSADLAIPITHFSGYGVNKGLLADTEPIRKRIGGDVEDRLSAVAADFLSRERQKQLLGTSTSDDNNDIAKFLQWYMETYYREVLKPRLDAAGESCAAGRLALETYLSFERQMELLGANLEKFDRMLGPIPGPLQSVMATCLQEEYELCRDQHIVHRLIPVYLGVLRQQQLLGMDDGGKTEALGEDLIRKCMSFELELQSTATTVTPGMDITARSTVESLVPLGWDFGQGMFGGIDGESALINRDFSITSPNCSLNPSRGGSTLHVQSLAWEVDFHSPDDELGYVKDITLTFIPDPTTESWTGNCTVGGVTFPYEAPEANVWSGTYGGLHAQECKAGSGGGAGNPPSSGGSPDLGSLLGQLGDSGDLAPDQLQALMGALQGGPGTPGTMFGCGVEHGWEVQGGETFATKTWDLSSSAPLQMSENGSFVLRHLPK